LDVDPLNAAGLPGVKTALRLWVPTVSELVDVVATPPETVTGAPMFAAPSLNCTVPVAVEGATVAVRFTVVPTVWGLGGETVSVVVVFCAAAGLIVIDSALVAVWAGELESVTMAVKLKVPAVVGVPEMAPVLALRVRPGGRVPVEIDQVYGVVPPLAVSVAE